MGSEARTMNEDAHLEAAYEERMAGPNEYYNDNDEVGDECMLCGEQFGADDEVGEFYNPAEKDSRAIVAHASRGIDNGLSVA